MPHIAAAGAGGPTASAFGFLQPTSDPSEVYLVLGAMSGTPANGPALSYSTDLTIMSPDAAAEVTLTYQPTTSLARVVVPMEVGANESLEVGNILESLFHLQPGQTSQGAVLVHSTSPLVLDGRIIALASPVDRFIAGPIPILSNTSEALISAVNQRTQPIYLDGLEQTVDESRGSRWSVLLTEVSGPGATVQLRLYESASRLAPVAEKEIRLGPNEALLLDSVFSAMGLEEATRKKQRNNVLLVVNPTGGNGTLAALAIERDNRTGDMARYVLTPNGGIPVTRISRLAEVIVPLPEPPPPRRRGVKRPR